MKIPKLHTTINSILAYTVPLLHIEPLTQSHHPPVTPPAMEIEDWVRTLTAASKSEKDQSD
jgi:hypothetical protein